jgi:hypothetical protein
MFALSLLPCVYYVARAAVTASAWLMLHPSNRVFRFEDLFSLDCLPHYTHTTTLSAYFPAYITDQTHLVIVEMSMKAALEASEVLSERSKKFYDGTYKWDTYGFEDERGGRSNLCLHCSSRS